MQHDLPFVRTLNFDRSLVPKVPKSTSKEVVYYPRVSLEVLLGTVGAKIVHRLAKFYHYLNRK